MSKESGSKIIIETVSHGENDGAITGVSLPIPDPCPRGIRSIIAEQIFIPGTDIRYYLPDEGVIKIVPAQKLEQVSQQPLDQRRNFVSELMSEIQFADRIAIEATRTQSGDLV